MVPNTVPARTAAAAVGFLLAGFASEAHAATYTYTYNFTGPRVGNEYELLRIFESTVAGGPTLTVTPYTVSDDGNSVASVTTYGVGQWQGNGLGLKNSSGDSSHTVDANGVNDLLVLAFASAVKMVNATFNYAGVLSGSDDDFAFFMDDNDLGIDLAGDRIFESNDIVGAPGNGGYYNFSPTLAVSTVFGFGASFYGCTQYYSNGNCKTRKYDSFKLASVTVQFEKNEAPPQVPLPAGAVLLLSGLTGMGLFGRFKNKSSKAAV